MVRRLTHKATISCNTRVSDEKEILHLAHIEMSNTSSRLHKRTYNQIVNQIKYNSDNTWIPLLPLAAQEFFNSHASHGKCFPWESLHPEMHMSKKHFRVNTYTHCLWLEIIARILLITYTHYNPKLKKV